MLFVKIVNGQAVSASTEFPEPRDESVQSRHHWKSFADVEQIAAQLTEATAKAYLPVDAGPNVSPRFDVIEAPTFGAKVSKAFNGDSYPQGEITKVSASYRRIETSTGAVFYRRHRSASWIEGGTWSMVFGHEDRRNPSF